MSLIRLVCAECGSGLRTITVPTGIETEQTVQLPQCDYCRERAVETAYAEGRQAGMETK